MAQNLGSKFNRQENGYVQKPCWWKSVATFFESAETAIEKPPHVFVELQNTLVTRMKRYLNSDCVCIMTRCYVRNEAAAKFSLSHQKFRTFQEQPVQCFCDNYAPRILIRQILSIFLAHSFHSSSFVGKFPTCSAKQTVHFKICLTGNKESIPKKEIR